MKTFLAILKDGGEIAFGGHLIFLYDDGTIGCRLAHSAVLPSQKATMAGLKRLLKLLDNETEREALTKKGK